MIPIAAQTLQCFILSYWATKMLSYWATKMYLPINLIRLDERSENVFLLIGEDIEIEIQPSGEWIS